MEGIFFLIIFFQLKISLSSSLPVGSYNGNVSGKKPTSAFYYGLVLPPMTIFRTWRMDEVIIRRGLPPMTILRTCRMGEIIIKRGGRLFPVKPPY